MIDVMQLGGPASRAHQGIQAIRNGRVLVTGGTDRNQRIADAIEDALPSYGFTLVSLSAEQTYQHAADALDVDTILQPGRLLSTPQFNRTVLKVDASSPAWLEWSRNLLSKMSGIAQQESLRLWMVCPEGPNRPKHRAMEAVDWHGCLTSADVRIYAAYLFRDVLGPGPTNYRESLAVELAGPDLDLLERMSRAPTSFALDPYAWLVSDTGHPMPSVPYEGSGNFESPLMLARRSHQDPRAIAELDQRIWKAQTRSLFVALESERAGVLAPFKRQLEDSYQRTPAPAYEQVSVIPRDVEWGAAQFRLDRDRSVPETIKDLLDAGKKARNCLAHGQAIDPPLLAFVLKAAGAAMKGRWAVP